MRWIAILVLLAAWGPSQLGVGPERTAHAWASMTMRDIAVDYRGLGKGE